MSENINLKELPHQFLLRKYSLNPQVLSTDAKQMIKDLDKTIRLVASKAKDGNVNLTPTTQQKITTYDRFICDGVFEYLEEQEKLTEAQSDKVEEQMDDKREVVEDKMDELHTEAIEELENKDKEIKSQPEATEAPETTETTETPEDEEISSADGEEQQPKDDESVKIGFWEWE